MCCRTGEALAPEVVDQILASAVSSASGERSSAEGDAESAGNNEAEEEYQPTILQTRSKRRRKVPVKLVEDKAPEADEGNVIKVSAGAVDDEFPAMM